MKRRAFHRVGADEETENPNHSHIRPHKRKREKTRAMLGLPWGLLWSLSI